MITTVSALDLRDAVLVGGSMGAGTVWARFGRLVEAMGLTRAGLARRPEPFGPVDRALLDFLSEV